MSSHMSGGLQGVLQGGGNITVMWVAIYVMIRKYTISLQ